MTLSPEISNDNSAFVGRIKKCLSNNPNERPSPKAQFDEIYSISNPCSLEQLKKNMTYIFKSLRKQLIKNNLFN